VPVTASALLRWFWQDFVRRHALQFGLGVLFLLATNALAVGIPQFVQHAVDALTEATDRAHADTAVRWALAIVAAGAGIVGVRTLSRTLFFNPGRTVELRLKNALFDHLLALPRSFYDRMRPGEIVSRGTNDTNWVRALVGFGTLQIFNVVMMLILTLGQMILADWTLTLWCVGPLVAASLILRVAVARMFSLTIAFNNEVAALSNTILETYNGIGVLNAFDAVPGAERRFEATNAQLERLATDVARHRSWSLPVVSLVGNLCIVIVLYVGGLRVEAGDLSLGELAAFTVYVNLLVSGLTTFGWMINAVQRGYLSLARVHEVATAPLEREVVSADVPPPAPRGYGLRVEGLTFAYPAAPEKKILDDLSFEIAPGETVGLFGLTGAGKSTLLGLLARVQDAPPGAVRIYGEAGPAAAVDLVRTGVRDWRRHVAYVPQEAFLFSMSLRENIALAETAATPDAARLDAAVTDAALSGDLKALPEGLDTLVGERGITLSGGQRQRAALARAWYRDFDLLLLDDVMSAVDHATEKQLIEATYRRCTRATTLIVSHRCSVLARAERILVLSEGRLIASGTHEALLADAEGPYARAWRLQQAAAAIEETGDAPPAATGAPA
jgi:ATP-binding cassette subfamily B multidrug efflux pump